MSAFKTVVVAGGAGFLGSHLCRRLLADGHGVVCVDNLSTGSLDNIDDLAACSDFRFVRADVVEPLAVQGDVAAVCHLASPASPRAYLARPVETLLAGSAGTRHTLELAREKQARYLLASTSEVYGDPRIHPQPECYWGHVNPIGPRSVYDEAKRFAEALTTAYRKTHGVDTAIARIFNTYGPGMRADDGRIVPTFIRQAVAGEPITVHGDGSQTRSLCYVDDTVEGLVRLLRSSHHGPVNIGNPRELSVRRVAEMVREVTGSRSPIASLPRMVDDPEIRCPDISLAAETLGWQPSVSLELGLRVTAGHLLGTKHPHDGSAFTRTGGDGIRPSERCPNAPAGC
ncbi:UDP-glucuronic acid decarboxylase family protein [Streptomyces sp. CA-181903]|uniref:UDP-glucuronic acid decarboxylase family protein n=1 Tax=Streptomyces sp. CA-181903 TaxID=3240055 RepID=UPI003D8CDB55